jgi:hypothetical protein
MVEFDFGRPEPLLSEPAAEHALQGSKPIHPASRAEGMRVLLVGAGNIGRPAAWLLAHSGARVLRLVDRGAIEVANVASQGYCTREVGQFKAHALERKIRDDCPSVRIESYAMDLEDVPQGLFDVDVVIGALDSRRARQYLTEMAWSRGVPVIDGGVGVTSGLVGRAAIFRPGPECACLECGLSREDYRLMSLEYSCGGNASPVEYPTGAPLYLGWATASIMIAETARLFCRQAPAGSYEVVVDLWNARCLRSRLRRSPDCRFDHRVVHERIPLARPFATAAAADLISLLEREYPDQAVHLECRRGIRLAGPSSRVIPRAALLPLEGALLSELGFTPGDQLRVRSERGRDAFIILEGTAGPSEGPQ